nr:unnamed protein product [Digitaria exilis]
MGSAATESNDTLLGNGVVGILAETCNMWERRAPLTPSHCARLLLGGGKNRTQVNRIVVQPSTKRIHHDAQYEDAGCEITEDLSECGLIIGIKQPKLQMILPDRAYAFFSHTHKAQKENMPLLDKILEERVSLFDYELIVGDDGKRSLAFGKFAGRAGLIDFLHGLGQLSQGAQEVFKLLPHTFVDAEKLPEISAARNLSKQSQSTKRVFQVYGCVVTSRDMVSHNDPTRHFDKTYVNYICSSFQWPHSVILNVYNLQADYYAHPENYTPVFHERIAPYASVIVNCMYWERRFPRLLSTYQLQQLMKSGSPLVGICDITCDIGGSIEFVDKSTSIEKPFFRDLAPAKANPLPEKKYSTLVSLSGHLFDKFLINEALDIIEADGASFQLVRCEVGQSIDDMSYSELKVGADDTTTLDKIMDSLTSLANAHGGDHDAGKETDLALKIGKVNECDAGDTMEKGGPKVLILGAGRVCRPAAEFLASYPNSNYCVDDNSPDQIHVIVASLYQKDAEEIVDGIKNTTATQLDVADIGSLSDLVSQVEVVVSLLPTSFHAAIARVCIEFKKHMVTASYVDESMSNLSQAAKAAGVTILCEMGLDPGIDHLMSMKMIDEAHARKGKVKAFTSFCGGLPSPAAANNPLAYKFSWNPAGAVRSGKNPAVYKFLGETIHVDGFSEIMATLSKIGFFDAANHPLLQDTNRPTYKGFLNEILIANNISTTATNLNVEASTGYDDELIARLLSLGYCKEKEIASKTAKTIKFLGLHEETEIPKDCSSAFDVICQRMEQRMVYGHNEQDMVLLHHEVEVEYPDGRPTEKHQATLLEFGKVENGRSTTAMALTVGVPVAIGALLLLQNKVQTKGVIRPLEPEIYIPALEILESSGIKLTERMEI